MKYVKAKKIVDELSTKQIKGFMNIIIFTFYGSSNDGFDHYGVNTDDAGLLNLIASQDALIEAQEETYLEIAPLLKSCRMMNEYDKIVERKIAEKYSIGKEFKMRDLPPDNPDRIEYENYKSAIKTDVRLMKIEMGLLQ